MAEFADFTFKAKGADIAPENTGMVSVAIEDGDLTDLVNSIGIDDLIEVLNAENSTADLLEAVGIDKVKAWLIDQEKEG